MPADIALLYELSAKIGRLTIHRLVTSDIALGKPSSKNERLLPSCHITPELNIITTPIHCYRLVNHTAIHYHCGEG